MRNASIRVFACAVLMAVVAAVAAATAMAAAGKVAKVGAAADWTAHGAAADESDYSRLDELNVSNIKRLGLAWSFDLPGESTLEANPLAVDGVLYFTGSYAAVYAVDAVSGKLLWKFDPETWKSRPFQMHFTFAANRGAAYSDGRIYSAAVDGRLFALDAKTGTVIWTADTTGPQSMQTVTGAPRVLKDKVIIGNGGADFGQRGYVTAYDAATGKQAWRFYITPGSPEQNKGDAAMERAAATWKGEYWKSGTGGAVWDAMTYDPELNRVYLGTGNGGPYDPEARSPGGGDNLYTASIVALDADTGKYVWHYQLNPRDSWDYDATQQMTLTDLVIDGKKRKVLLQAPKNGFFYVLDRRDGKLISAEKIGKATWADHIDLETGRPVEARNIRYEQGEVILWPSPAGAHAWMSMSFSPKTGLVYIPYMQLGVHFSKGKPIPRGVTVAGLSVKDYEADSDDAKGSLIAWNPVTQKAAWRARHDTMWNGGVLSTAGGLVFQGTGAGIFHAYNARTGESLWQFDGAMGIIAAPVSYSAKGHQYVSVLAGYGGSAAIWGEPTNVGWKYSGPRRLLTFALDATAKLPESPARDMTVHAVDDPSIKIDPKEAAMGYAMYLACAACHGRNLVSTGGPAPDLRESQLALNPDAFYSVVHDGILIQHGMPRFENFKREQVMALWAYVRSGAREVASQATGAQTTNGQAATGQ
jgi:quinohemoprotein ethanol dehydrogenase